MDPKQHGVFSWNELMTTDLEGAKRFYGDLFGWSFEEMPISSGPLQGQTYVSAKIGEEYAAGLMPMPPGTEGMGPGWGAYVTVNSLAESLEKVKRLGGKIHLDVTPIPDMGSFAVISDPQGAVISLFEFTK